MAFNTYATLGPALERITGLNDLVSSGMADDAILYFESWVNRNIRHRSMLVTTTTLSLTASKVDHPNGWLQWESLENPTTKRLIEIRPGFTIADINEQNLTGNSIYAVPRATNTEFYPIPTSITGVRGTYYTSLPPIITNSTNWLLTNHPDIYLNACLLAITMWKRDNEEANKYSVPFEQVTGELVRNDERTTFGGSPLVIRTPR